MAGINLMAYAQGAELANQANWRDVLNEFSTAQQQQNLTQQQADFGLRYPLAQEQTQEQLALLQGNRAVADTQARILQEASKLPTEQRSGFMLDELQKSLQSLDPGTPSGRAGISSINSMVINQLNNAMKVGDEKSYREILARFPSFVNPLSGRDQQLQRTQSQVQQMNTQFPQPGGQFMFDPVTRAVRFVQTTQPQVVGGVEQGMYDYAPVGMNTTPMPVSVAPMQMPAVTANPMAVPMQPAAVPLQPTAAAPYANVRWQDMFNPWSIPNTQLRADIGNWMPQWLTAPAQQPATPMPFGTFNMFGGGLR